MKNAIFSPGLNSSDTLTERPFRPRDVDNCGDQRMRAARIAAGTTAAVPIKKSRRRPANNATAAITANPSGRYFRSPLKTESGPNSVREYKITPAPIAIANIAVRYAATRSEAVVSPCHTLLSSSPMIIARAGIAGSIYPGSLDSENEKKITGTASHDHASQCRNL